MTEWQEWDGDRIFAVFAAAKHCAPRTNFLSPWAGVAPLSLATPAHLGYLNSAMTVTIYHNPKCGTSRNVLEILRAHGIELVIIEYLKTPLSRGEIAALVKKMQVPVRDIVRAKEAIYTELNLDNADDAALLDAMAEHPILLNRPIVITPKGAKLCRPSETVVALL